ncbi:hypothetical protein MKW98_020541 [Papaver atlanticum]|uniref:Uncharacterized protein n=1 Tax=Papaver atlanticum TaxID=357466 RepID=A0AAD4SMS6_9MAGN|nr:hypothetical protein MKW98_020541 [Papaver atlanticum]
MRDVASRLAERGIALAVSDATLDVLLTESYGPVCDLFSSVLFCLGFGARPISRWLEKKAVTELSKMLVKEEEKKRMSWVSLKKICKPKKKVGPDIRDLIKNFELKPTS